MEEEETALRVEAAIIDVLGKEELTNLARRSGVYGRVEIHRLLAHFHKERVEIEEPTVLIRLATSFRFEMSSIELYDATRGGWRIGTNRENLNMPWQCMMGLSKKFMK